MSHDALKQAIQTILPEAVKDSSYNETGHHLDITVSSESLVQLVEVLDQKGFYLVDVTAVDLIPEIEVVYHFALWQKLYRIIVRAYIPRNHPEIPTISHIYPGADWHERETFDFFGIKFLNHPELKRLLLPEDADFHPLLKKESLLEKVEAVRSGFRKGGCRTTYGD